MFTVLLDYYNEGRWGDLASIAGLATALVGFAITVFQTARARTAAEAANSAVAQVRREIARVRTAADFGAALAVMDEVKILHRRGEWELLAARYTTLRKSLIAILASSPQLSDAHRSTLVASVQQFVGLEHEIERLLHSQNQADVPRLNKIVARQIDRLYEVVMDIENDIGD